MSHSKDEERVLYLLIFSASSAHYKTHINRASGVL